VHRVVLQGGRIYCGYPLGVEGVGDGRRISHALVLALAYLCRDAAHYDFTGILTVQLSCRCSGDAAA
jgi:hypothetical protein